LSDCNFNQEGTFQHLEAYQLMKQESRADQPARPA
jgi:hypothetical protein